MWRTIRTTAVALAVAVIACDLRGDSVTLKNGQVFEGRVVETKDKVTVFLPYATVAFYREEISVITYGETPAEEYKLRVSKLSKGDAEGHYQLGLFCEGKKMPSEARAEYEKAIAADANHAGARTKLGYVREGDKWITYADYMAQKGYVPYKGRYVTSEQAQELQEKDANVARVRDATNLVRTLAYMITYTGEGKSSESIDRLSGVSDPAALDALVEQLDNQNPAVRGAVLTALVNYREDKAALAVLGAALYEPTADLRNQARENLLRRRSELVFEGTLHALSVDDDTVRFRASELLGAYGDTRAIPYLIEYLSWTRPVSNATKEVPDRFAINRRPVTPQYVIGVRAKVAAGVVAYEPIMGTYDHGRIVEFHPEPQYQEDTPAPGWNDEVVLNYDALNALKAMTGQDFRFEKQDWRDYYLANRWRFENKTAQPPQGN